MPVLNKAFYYTNAHKEHSLKAKTYTDILKHESDSIN
jgi:hypothetical protein